MRWFDYLLLLGVLGLAVFTAFLFAGDYPASMGAPRPEEVRAADPRPAPPAGPDAGRRPESVIRTQPPRPSTPARPHSPPPASPRPSDARSGR